MYKFLHKNNPYLVHFTSMDGANEKEERLKRHAEQVQWHQRHGELQSDDESNLESDDELNLASDDSNSGDLNEEKMIAEIVNRVQHVLSQILGIDNEERKQYLTNRLRYWLNDLLGTVDFVEGLKKRDQTK